MAPIRPDSPAARYTLADWARDHGMQVADMGAGQFRRGALQDYRNLGEPLQNFGGGHPGESQWFLNLTPNMRRNFGHDWPGSPLQAPPTMQPDARTPTYDPSRMLFWPWLYPGQRGSAAW